MRYSPLTVSRGCEDRFSEHRPLFSVFLRGWVRGAILYRLYSFLAILSNDFLGGKSQNVASLEVFLLRRLQKAFDSGVKIILEFPPFPRRSRTLSKLPNAPDIALFPSRKAVNWNLFYMGISGPPMLSCSTKSYVFSEHHICILMGRAPSGCCMCRF